MFSVYYNSYIISTKYVLHFFSDLHSETLQYLWTFGIVLHQPVQFA